MNLIMRLALLLLTLLVPLILIPTAASAFKARVVWVTDGDTLTVFKDGWSLEKIRIYGLDCPESDQPYGFTASMFTLWNFLFREVEITPMDRDRYGRLVARLSHEGTSVNEAIIKAGYAWVYDRYCQAGVCARYRLLEKQARQAGQGLWEENNPIPPWRWRHGERPDSGWRFW